MDEHGLDMGERLHYRTRREVDSKETERLLEEQSEDQNDEKPRACTDTCSVSWDDSTVGSAASPRSEYKSTCTSILAAQKQTKKTYRSLFLRNFYLSSDGEVERITPFAVVLLIVLLAVYVLNQADRLVLPVVIPNGLRCDVGKEDCASLNSTTNASSSAGNKSSSDADCIQFNDDQQGLLTGVYIYDMLVCIERTFIRSEK